MVVHLSEEQDISTSTILVCKIKGKQIFLIYTMGNMGRTVKGAQFNVSLMRDYSEIHWDVITPCVFKVAIVLHHLSPITGHVEKISFWESSKTKFENLLSIIYLNR